MMDGADGEVGVTRYKGVLMQGPPDEAVMRSGEWCLASGAWRCRPCQQSQQGMKLKSDDVTH